MPAPDGRGKRLLVGEISGPLLFDNPFDGGVIDLSDDSGLEVGEDWNRPYVGLKSNLSARNKLYSWNTTGSYSEKESPPVQHYVLIERIRRIRESNGVRIVVNPWGLVLTKKPVAGRWSSDESTWQPVYVGRIRRDKWFEKEA